MTIFREVVHSKLSEVALQSDLMWHVTYNAQSAIFNLIVQDAFCTHYRVVSYYLQFNSVLPSDQPHNDECNADTVFLFNRCMKTCFKDFSLVTVKRLVFFLEFLCC
jgi:hypothetical protein